MSYCDGDWLDAIGEALDEVGHDELLSVATVALTVLARDYCPTAKAAATCTGHKPQQCAACWTRYVTEGE